MLYKICLAKGVPKEHQRNARQLFRLDGFVVSSLAFLPCLKADDVEVPDCGVEDQAAVEDKMGFEAAVNCAHRHPKWPA